MSRPTAYLGIDPSYSGFAYVFYTEEGYHVTLHDFSPEYARTGPDRLHYIYETLRGEWQPLGADYDVKHVVVEGYAPGAKFGREILGELGGVLKLALTYCFEPSTIKIVAPTALKKFTTGSGVAGKDVMLLSVFKKWGVTLDDNNLADAYAGARLAEALDTGGHHQYEKEVVASILTPKEKKKKAAA